jgi:hypothetical protein
MPPIGPTRPIPPPKPKLQANPEPTNETTVIQQKVQETVLQPESGNTQVKPIKGSKIFGNRVAKLEKNIRKFFSGLMSEKTRPKLDLDKLETSHGIHKELSLKEAEALLKYKRNNPLSNEQNLNQKLVLARTEGKKTHITTLNFDGTITDYNIEVTRKTRGPHKIALLAPILAAPPRLPAWARLRLHVLRPV